LDGFGFGSETSSVFLFADDPEDVDRRDPLHECSTIISNMEHTINEYLKG
jgi:hypothetical protein